MSMRWGSEYVRGVSLGSTPAKAVYRGDTKIWPPPSPSLMSYTNAGSYTYTIPAGYDKIDVILLGGGGSGAGGQTFSNNYGNGGGGGQWHTTTLTRGVDFPTNATTISGTIGTGGAGASANSNGQPGNPTTATISGYVSLQANGGAAGIGQNTNGNGLSPGNIAYNDREYIGGAQANGPGNAVPANSPGGGSPGGEGRTLGTGRSTAAGASGAAWFYAYSGPRPYPLFSTMVSYDATGTGGTGSGSTSTYTATGTHECSGSAVVVAVSASSFSGSISSCTVTYGGQPMTLLGSDTAGGASYSCVYLFGILNPPTGSQTISVSASGTYMIGLTMTSVSYHGVVSFGTAVSVTGATNPPTHTVSAHEEGSMIAHTVGLFANASVLTYNQTLRSARNTTYSSICQGDAEGAPSVTFSPTFSSHTAWACIAVELIP